MEYRQLGNSGLRVSVIGMGTMTFGNSQDKAVGCVGVDAARSQIDLCMDRGVNLFDTADVYGTGESESVLGEAIAHRRNEAIIATKVGGAMGTGPNDKGSSRLHIISGCETSLRRLKTDHIDLFQLHKWDGTTPMHETMEALDRLIRDGKVRYVGCSNFSSWHVMKGICASEVHKLNRFVSQQIHYSVESRDAEYELIPLSIDQKIGVIVWGPLAGGLLSGKFGRDNLGPEGSRHHGRIWHEPPIYDNERLYQLIDVLKEFGEKRGCSAARIAIAWILHQPGITSVLIGGRTELQLSDTLDAESVILGSDELKKLDEVSRPLLLYPYWHQAWTDKARLSPADLSLLEKYKRP